MLIKFKKIILVTLLLLIPTFALSACNQEKKDVQISMLSSSSQDGMVLGGGIYKEDETATFIANASSGKTFVAWIKNNKIVSEESVFSFKVKTSSAGTYTAVFKGENPTYLKPFATSFNAKSKTPENSLVIRSINLDFAIGDSTQYFNLTNIEDINFSVHDNSQTSNTYDFNSEYLLRLRSDYEDQTYNLLAKVTYTIGDLKRTVPEQIFVTLVHLLEGEKTYFETIVPVIDDNIEAYVSIYFAPAGIEITSADLIFA